MFSFGEQLRRERERRGIDLSQIARETNIARRFLEAIESGRVDSIPGRFYRRAYIRAYARQLGLDPTRFVAAYEFAEAGEAHAHALQASMHGGYGAPFAAAVKWMALAIVGLGLSGAAAAVWRRAPEAPPRSPLSEVLVFQPAAAEGPPESIKETLPSAPFAELGPFVEDELGTEAPTPAVVQLRLKVDEPCWLEVSADGERLAEGIMAPGFDREFRGEEICLSLGNAGGVTYWIDDRVGKPLGQPGQVQKDICVTSDNVTDFVGQEREGARTR